jgi:hypothetical protein
MARTVGETGGSKRHSSRMWHFAALQRMSALKHAIPCRGIGGFFDQSHWLRSYFFM